MERVLDYIEVGRREGARVVTGGERILEETGGWFVPPTIFDDVRNDMRIAREEIFGPVLSVIEFETEAEAVAHRQRHAVRPGGLALHRGPQRRPPGGPGPARPASSASTPTPRAT